MAGYLFAEWGVFFESHRPKKTLEQEARRECWTNGSEQCHEAGGTGKIKSMHKALSDLGQRASGQNYNVNISGGDIFRPAPRPSVPISVSIRRLSAVPTSLLILRPCSQHHTNIPPFLLAPLISLYLSVCLSLTQSMPMRLWVRLSVSRGNSNSSCRCVAKMPVMDTLSISSRIAPARDAPSLLRYKYR